ncbi:hypothetical protein IQ217_13920 [Synechocystis salina LEGE 00031]|uniref:Uncharacterized protein n=2 Tax=Synechocystis TaxID=1142 RepID=A0ABR9VU92_9SYNC|nr:hypothetical protein [Synechocystis salina LEGE 00041]MBE9254917.1 hypothetical protein [Synechocystis salina LEGE 00031]
MVMRNALTIFALLLSSTGIFVSLAREELRCRVGLSSTECPPAIAQPENNAPQNGGAKLVNSGLHPTTPTGEKSDKTPGPAAETAKVLETETTGAIGENLLPAGESHGESPSDATELPSSPPLHSPLGKPMEQKAVDTAIISNPAPKKALPSEAPIAPPASKNPAEDHLIQVIPVEGAAIPVAPGPQE